MLPSTEASCLPAHMGHVLQDAKAEKFKEISKLVQEPRLDTLGLPSASAL